MLAYTPVVVFCPASVERRGSPFSVPFSCLCEQITVGWGVRSWVMKVSSSAVKPRVEAASWNQNKFKKAEKKSPDSQGSRKGNAQTHS